MKPVQVDLSEVVQANMVAVVGDDPQHRGGFVAMGVSEDESLTHLNVIGEGETSLLALSDFLVRLSFVLKGVVRV